MQTRLIDEKVDINNCPHANYDCLKPGGELTIGDLHGNTQLFLFTLKERGIIEFDSEAQYESLIAIYEKPVRELSKYELQQFARIIQKIKVNKQCKVRLIGDELADRGNNDCFTLLLLQKLQQEQLPMEVLLSNHSLEFLRYLAEGNNYFPSITPTISLGNLRTLLHQNKTKEFLSFSYVQEIATNHYKPLLKILSYTLSDDKKDITLFSHAPININKIKALAKYFNVGFDDSSAQGLAKTIDEINRVFQEEVQNHTINKRFEEVANCTTEEQQRDHPLAYILWNRKEDIDRNHEHNGFKVTYVHGHTGVAGYYNQEQHLINLNGDLGKAKQFCKDRYLLFFQRSISTLLEFLSKSKINEDLKKSMVSVYEQLPSSSMNIKQFQKEIGQVFAQHSIQNLEDYKAILPALIDDSNILSLILNQSVSEDLYAKSFEAFSTSPETELKNIILIQIKDNITSPDEQVEFYKKFFSSLQKYPKHSSDIDVLLKIGNVPDNKEVFLTLSEFYFEGYVGRLEARREDILKKITSRLSMETNSDHSLCLRSIAINCIPDTKIKDILIKLQEKFTKNAKLPRNKEGLKLLDTLLINYSLALNPDQKDEKLGECIDLINKSMQTFERHQDIMLSRLFFCFFIILPIIPLIMKLYTGNYFMQTDSSKKIKDLKKELQKLKGNEPQSTLKDEDQKSLQQPHA